MSAIDTPDYQRGVVNAQVLLATNAALVTSCIVGIPPNTETMVVIVPGGGQSTPPLAQGQTSGQLQRGVPVNLSEASGLVTSWFFDVTSAVDAQVEVQIETSSPDPWYVYADSGVHIVSDGTKLSNQIGEQYVIPTVPNTGTADHPPVELSHVTLEATGVQSVIAAPGAGKRLRIFTAGLTIPTAGQVAQLYDSVSNVGVLLTVGQGTAELPFIGQGIPLSTNAGLLVNGASGSGAVYASAVYTTESV